jgi:ABC-type Fe3+-hydroxamate transport system substrate-binding protein
MSTNRMDEKLFAPVLALGLVLTAACTSESAATESSSVAAEELNTPSLTPAFASPVTPPPPAVNRDVALVESETYAYPYIPAFRTSADGRVALSLKEMDDGQLSFYVMAPEGRPTATT